jgi:error-prone DNA polymerase
MRSAFNDSDFVHLHVHSEFSFLDGATPVAALVQRAAELQMPALALTDHDNLCGAPEFHVQCRKHGLRPIFGAELTLDSGHITVLAKNRRSFSSLCRLLTHSHLSRERGSPSLSEEEFLESEADWIVLSGCQQSPLIRLLAQKRYDQARHWAARFRERFSADFYVELMRTLEAGQKQLSQRLIALARELAIPLVATNNVHYLESEQAQTQDLLTCIRHLITVDEPHSERKINRELRLKPAAEMRQLFGDVPEAIHNTLRIAEACEDYEISEPRFQPRFVNGHDIAAAERLRALTYQGAQHRYTSILSNLRQRIEYELRIICELGFADYFLVVHDLVQFARTHSFRHAGRGSAADSVVAYCLNITKVDAFARNLRFERFINPERRENLPDIDIDFDARHRDKVTDYVTQKYGKDHVATVCTYSRFRARGAIRDVAKALGFEPEDIDKIAKNTHWATSGRGLSRALENRPELRALNISKARFGLLLELCEGIDDLPRHIGTHLGGVVITGDPIWEITPIQMAAKGVQIMQYDKEGVEDLKLLKLDLLCLRMLGAVEDSVQMITQQDQHFDLDKINVADDQTFRRIRTGETAGAFQIESPAQMSLHPRLKTRTYEDIVASVALIRPGPVQGEMVEPFIRRRNELETIQGIHPVIDRILSHTYGVVLYQEQVISIAVELAGFSPGQADTLRRTISHRRSHERMAEIGAVFVQQAMANGIERAIAEKVFSWLEGYAGYGFCEAHAAAFGDTSYRTAYLLQHHPAEFYAAVLNNQPMGFYPPATVVNEARKRGIRILPPDASNGGIEFDVVEGAIRTGLKQVKGICEANWNEICKRRPYHSWRDFLNRCHVPRDILESLILCGAAEKFHANRRALLFSLGEQSAAREGELAFPMESDNIAENIPDFSDYEKLCYEWETLNFSPKWHPLEFWRKRLAAQGVTVNEAIKAERRLDKVFCAAGWVIRPHTPPTKSGKTVVFFSLEDETGLLNVTVFPAIYERFGHLIFTSPLLMIQGRKDRRGANSLVAETITKLGQR